MRLRLNKTVGAVASSALLLMAVPAVGIASASGASSKTTYTIGYEGPLTGSSPQLGLNMEFAVELAISNANASGRLPFTLAFKAYDDQGDPTISPTQAQAAVANKTLVAIVGPAYSGATHAAEPYYSKAHIATVSPSATLVGLAVGTNNNFMRVVAGDNVQGAADANFLVKTLGKKSLEVINDASLYGAGLAHVVAAQAKSDGAKVTATTVPGTSQCQNGTASASEYTAAATQVKSTGAKALFYGGYYCDLALFLGTLKSAGYTGTIMSGDGSVSPVLISSTTPPTAANGVYLSVAGGGTPILTGSLANQYKKLAGFSAANATYAAQAYDATNMIITALGTITRSANITTVRSAVVKELHSITYKGVTGKIKFLSNGNLASGSTNAKPVVNFYKIVNKKIPTKPTSHS